MYICSRRWRRWAATTEYDYRNGHEVLLYPDPIEPKVTINVTYLVGYE